MKSKLVVAAMLLTASMYSFAQDTGADYIDAPAPTLTRAEVRAELAMWKRAGLDRYSGEYGDYFSAEFRGRNALFGRLVNGPAYVAELQRIQGGATRTANAVDRTTSSN
jgi:Domain of unknown function (DUF4148)